MAKLTPVRAVFPYTGLLRFFTQSHNSDNKLKQTIFHTENARFLSKSAVFARWTYTFPVVGGLQGCYGKANLLLGAVQKHPLT